MDIHLTIAPITALIAGMAEAVPRPCDSGSF